MTSDFKFDLDALTAPEPEPRARTPKKTYSEDDMQLALKRATGGSQISPIPQVAGNVSNLERMAYVSIFLIAVVIGVVYAISLFSGDSISPAINTNGIAGNVQSYLKADAVIVGDMYKEGARLVDSGELKSLAEFQDWKKINEDQREPARQIHLRPIFAEVNGSSGEQDTNKLSKVLKSVGEGYQR